MPARPACALALMLLLAGAAPGQARQEHRAGPRPVHDLAGTVIDLGRDFREVLLAPLWMDRGDWLATGGVVAAGGVLFLLDEDITRMALRTRRDPVIEEIGDIGDFFEPLGLMGNTNVWYAGGAVVSWAAGWDRPKRLFTELLYSHWIAGTIRGGVNRVVGRYRPTNGRGSRHFALGGGTSFPSGHASTIFQLAAVLAYHADTTPASIALYGMAATVAWQRIHSEQHWASDVWLGAAYGWAVAQIVVRLHEQEAIRIEPARGADGALGVAVRVRF